MDAKRLLIGTALSAIPSLCCTSDTYSGSEWGLLTFLVSFVYILPVYAISLAVFLPLRRSGSIGFGVLAYALPFAVVCVGVLLAGNDLFGVPLVGAWIVTWVFTGCS
jgi:hypothetical protein